MFLKAKVKEKYLKFNIEYHSTMWRDVDFYHLVGKGGEIWFFTGKGEKFHNLTLKRVENRVVARANDRNLEQQGERDIDYQHNSNPQQGTVYML